MSQAAYARRIEVTPQYISKIVQQGKLTLEPNGLLDPDKADAELRSLRHRERDPFRKSVIPDGSVAPNDYKDYQKARTIQAAYKARLTQLEYSVASGNVVKKDDMKTSLFIAARVARDALMAIPKRISALLAAESDRAKVEALLRKEIMQALNSLAEEEIIKMFTQTQSEIKRAAYSAAESELVS